MDSNNKSNNSNSTDTRANIFLKGLLQRMEEGNLTDKEQNIVHQLKHRYTKENNGNKLSKIELNRAVKRNRQAIAQKTTQSTWNNKRKPIQRWLAVGTAAAILLLVLALPFYKNIQTALQSPDKTIADTYRIDQEFKTGHNIKKIVLADGSTLYLNTESSVTIRKKGFDVSKREIWLDEGEVFFDIVKDPKRPFIIHLPNGITTRVLGTSFNIRAYRDMPEQVISVKTGKVQVIGKENEIFLESNHKVSISESNGNFISGITDSESVSSWISGKIMLENANIKELAFRLKQYYNVELIYDENQFGNDRIHTFFTVKTPLEETLIVIGKLLNATYTREDNTKIRLQKTTIQ